MTPESTGPQDVRSYLRVLWRWRLLFLAFLIVIPAAAYVIERGKPKVYQSSTLLELTGQVSTGGSGAAVVPPNPLAVAQLVTTNPVANAAAAMLNPRGSPGHLLGEVTASADTSTGFLTIAARDRSPQRAAAIANDFAAALSGQQSTQAKQVIDSQIAAYQRQLAATPAKDQAARAALDQQIAGLQGQRDASRSGVQVIERAVASATPAGPETQRAVEIALVIGLLLGIGAVVLAENGDLRLRTPEGLEQMTKLPLLGAIPPSAFSADDQDDGAFQMLSASLMFFNVDRPLASVAIISPGPWEGKTTVAAGLATAAARAGSHVILVDADLRRPMISERLGIVATAGLGAVLAREESLAAVLAEHPVDAAPGGSLRVLPSGPPPPNPAALLASREMQTLLRELEGISDLVILDTPAALAVGDALPLFRAVSGVLMIVRMNHSSRAAVRRMQKVIASANGTVVGVVATGSSATAGGYGDGYRYYAEGEGGPGRRSLLRRGRHARRRRRSSAAHEAAVASAVLDELAPRSASAEPDSPEATQADPPSVTLVRKKGPEPNLPEAPAQNGATAARPQPAPRAPVAPEPNGRTAHPRATPDARRFLPWLRH